MAQNSAWGVKIQSSGTALTSTPITRAKAISNIAKASLNKRDATRIVRLIGSTTKRYQISLTSKPQLSYAALKDE